MKQIKLVLPPFFGFAECGVMLRDVKTNTVFSINELTKDEQDEWYIKEVNSRGLKDLEVSKEQE